MLVIGEFVVQSCLLQKRSNHQSLILSLSLRIAFTHYAVRPHTRHGRRHSQDCASIQRSQRRAGRDTPPNIFGTDGALINKN
jgi:hypothetical protein